MVTNAEVTALAYDETLAARVRDALAPEQDVAERKMFGGLSFLVGGHMCCGIVKNELMVRVGPERYDAALARPHARRMDFTGRALKGRVYVAPAGVSSQADLAGWVAEGLGFARTLPAKASVPAAEGRD